MMVPPEHRADVVARVEERIVALYGSEDDARRFRVAHPPVQRQGYVEQVITTYEVKPDPPARAGQRRADNA